MLLLVVVVGMVGMEVIWPCGCNNINKEKKKKKEEIAKVRTGEAAEKGGKTTNRTREVSGVARVVMGVAVDLVFRLQEREARKVTQPPPRNQQQKVLPDQVQ
jgi:hypothetical protein